MIKWRDITCDVYDFTSIREAILEAKGKLSLEDEVRVEMLEDGLNPHNPTDINLFWKERCS